VLGGQPEKLGTCLRKGRRKCNISSLFNFEAILAVIIGLKKTELIIMLSR
jgi:hypothetical protein